MANAVIPTWEMLERAGLVTSYDDRSWFEKLIRKPIRKGYIMRVF